MASQNRKFQVGQSVVLSNPNASRAGYRNQEFTIERYITGERYPYRLDGGLYVSPKEITLAVDATLVEPKIELLTSDLSEQPVVVSDLNKLAFQNQSFQLGDKVVIAFVASPEQAHYFGFAEKAKNHTESYENHFSKKLNAKGRIRSVDSDNSMYGVEYDQGGWDEYPAISVQHRNVNSDPILYTFQGSSDRDVKVYKDRVEVGRETFTFDLFDRLLKSINEHKKSPKTGYDRNIRLEQGWDGIMQRNYLAVGCQRFPYNNIVRLCAAIRAVHALQK